MASSFIVIPPVCQADFSLSLRKLEEGEKEKRTDVEFDLAVRNGSPASIPHGAVGFLPPESQISDFDLIVFSIFFFGDEKRGEEMSEKIALEAEGDALRTHKDDHLKLSSPYSRCP